MSDASPRDWYFYIDDMVKAGQKVLAYSAGFDQPGFVASGLNYDATVRNLEIIGEAAARLSDETRAAIPEIPWADVIGMRNRLVHVYFDIDLERLWDTVQQDLPRLAAELDRVLEGV